jgi:putative ABC transport system substrate-binding protein
MNHNPKSDFGLRRELMNKTLWIGSLSGPNLKSKIQNLKWCGIVAIVLTFAFGGAVAQAQQPGKVPRIGYLANSLSSNTGKQNIAAFHQGLRELGYVEGQNAYIERRSAEGERVRLPKLAAELVRLNVDVIVAAGGTETALAAKEATNTVPIVMTNVGNPVARGLVASLARPGGNVTGLTSASPDLAGKRLELLKESVPRLTRVAVLYQAANRGNTANLKETELAAQGLGVKLQSQAVANPGEFEKAFSAITKGRAEALIVLRNTFFGDHLTRIIEFTRKSHLPTMYYAALEVEAGGLMSYGPRYTDLYRRAATYVDKILKGAKPADLPVEQPTKFELIINLKAAKQIGLTIPPNVLARADRVIK